MGTVAASADQPKAQDGLPSIFADQKSSNMPPISSGREGGKDAAPGDDNLEISDSEAPDVEQAKKNLRKQQEKKKKSKKQKTVVQGVQEDLQVDEALPVKQTEPFNM